MFETLSIDVADQEHRNSLKPGHQLLWYRVDKILGQGGFGITYRAHDQNLDQDVAVKEYLPVELSVRDQDSSVHPVSGKHGEQYKWGLERFISEARTLAKFNHDNVVRVLSVFEQNNTAYMVMHYEEGESLQDLLTGRKTMEEAELLGVLIPLLDGLEKVHDQGFIHRDIKPANIFIRKDGSAVLLDFGSARQALGGQTRTLTSVVSPGYAPFEQYFSKSDKQGPWIDIYGLGATLYRAVVGTPPIDAIMRSEAILQTHDDKIVSAEEAGAGRYSPAFLRAIDHAIQFRDTQRPRSVAEWRAEIEGTVPVPVVSPVAAAPVPAPTPPAEPVLVSRTFRPTQPPDTHPSTRPVTQPATQAAAPAPVSQEVIYSQPPPPKGKSSFLWGVLSTLLVAGIAVGLWVYRAPIGAWMQTIEIGGEPKTAEARDEREAKIAAMRQAAEEARRERELREGWERERQEQDAKRKQELADQKAQATREAEQQRRLSITRLLEQAQADIDAQRLAAPAGNNAAQKYREILAIEKGNALAVAGLDRILRRYDNLIKASVDKGRVTEAGKYLQQAAVLNPDAKWTARQRGRIDGKRKSTQRQSEFRKLIGEAEAHMKAGRYVEPAGANAYESYKLAAALIPKSGAVKQGNVDLGNKLMELSDEASSNDDFALAYSYLDKAEELLPDRPEIKNARRFVGIRELSYKQEQRRQQEFAQGQQRERDEAAAQEAFLKEQLARAQRTQQPPGAGATRWGAIAYSPDGAFGHGYDFASPVDAEQRALAECAAHDSGCEVKATFSDCGALADAEVGSWGWASRANVGEAKAAAIAACQGYTSGQCEVRTGFCANGAR